MVGLAFSSMDARIQSTNYCQTLTHFVVTASRKIAADFRP